MVFVDYLIFAVYMILVIGVGFYFYRKNENREDYYVGGREISATHVGLSIVATDVGGGFSIGLGGLGFLMGVSGSWLLFSGLVGAWMAAVLIIPKIKHNDRKLGLLTYPDFLRTRYGNGVAMAAAVISGIGYLGFTGGQIMAGAKLAAATLFADLGGTVDPLMFSLVVMTAVIIGYTVLGGIKAVIYTDTIQWIVLLCGLLVAIPFALFHVGGWTAMREALPAHYFRLTALRPVQFINWMVTIVPIWFIGMTLYQRAYACRTEKDAKRACFIAGLFEYPVLAFTGVVLGMMARVLFPGAEAEMGLPLLIKHSLPPVITGVVIAAYFSAIMSTADSCLIASSSNFVNDIIHRRLLPDASMKQIMRLSQIATLVIGVLTFVIASSFQTVLELILHAYSFMVAGLFIPTLGAFFWKKSDSVAALIAMIAGGSLTLVLIFSALPKPFGLDASFYGIVTSALFFVPLSLLRDGKVQKEDKSYG
ncbi:MAG TPA: sodium:solute symporter family protein [bacterium]|nr:sodium:solute symporter family protein [bacterium]HOX86110.1 sodium:solute symporter family protein [bacterium]HPG45676.1 sodium:solute symporter family protein [bacterium]HPM97545.1 sodium:solute symporter family protein [bacterium]